MRKYPLDRLKYEKVTKAELAKRLELGVFDMALPQPWLDKFVEDTGLDYGLVLSTTFWCYDKKSIFGFPVSGCSEVQKEIDRICNDK
ncbi:MAG: hypothetical protein R3321_11310 [Nitrososphaeraceae archaeon]|nr:hypothetical protein [Nitrososphaeraceae archaeon]